MAGLISDLPNASLPPSGEELIEVTQSGQSRKMQVKEIKGEFTAAKLQELLKERSYEIKDFIKLVSDNDDRTGVQASGFWGLFNFLLDPSTAVEIDKIDAPVEVAGEFGRVGTDNQGFSYWKNTQAPGTTGTVVVENSEMRLYDTGKLHIGNDDTNTVIDFVNQTMVITEGGAVVNTVDLKILRPGMDGEPGPKGDKGDPGVPGEPGPAGTNGTDGAKGDKGDPGETGAKGDKGDKGDTGAPGSQGIPGVDGKDGVNATGVNLIGEYPNDQPLPDPADRDRGDAYVIKNPDTDVKELWILAEDDAVPGTNIWVNLGDISGPQGLSAYELAVQEGYTGTLQQWLASLKGKDGTGIQVLGGVQSISNLPLINNNNGDAYVVRDVPALFVWTGEPGEGAGSGWEKTGEQGLPGDDAYQIAVKNGYQGSEEDWLKSLIGLSAYEQAKALGLPNTDTPEMWLASLVGPQGEKGDKGDTGETGPMGAGTRILGRVATEADLIPLEADLTDSDIGAGYLVGGPEVEQPPFFAWLGSVDKWSNVGPISGPKGDKGDTGDTGPKGDKGDPGAPGEQGDPGAAGRDGEDGAPGAPGRDGIDGATGATGEKGEKGDKGDKGDTGEALNIIGEVALPSELPLPSTLNIGDAYGVRPDLYVIGMAEGGTNEWTIITSWYGPKGDTGDTGAAGTKGDTGDKGDKGDVGAAVTMKGSVDTPAELPTEGMVAGDGYFVGTADNVYSSVWNGTGWVNSPRLNGPRGEDGTDGTNGTNGTDGAKGDKGDKGDTGDTGPIGPGLKILGNKATEAELPLDPVAGDAWWVPEGEAIHLFSWTGTAPWVKGPDARGPEGAKGDPGTPGAAGAKGDQGDTGETGAKGDKGDVGEPGETGPMGPGINLKGKVATSGELPPTGNTIGDGYIVGTDYWVWVDDPENVGTQIWENMGPLVGPRGERGPKGDPGNTGGTGPRGETGAKGDPGNRWIVTNKAPTVTDGNIGDYHLNTSTQIISLKTDVTTWVQIEGHLGGGNVYDANADGKMYVRLNNNWVELPVKDVTPGSEGLYVRTTSGWTRLNRYDLQTGTTTTGTMDVSVTQCWSIDNTTTGTRNVTFTGFSGTNGPAGRAMTVTLEVSGNSGTVNFPAESATFIWNGGQQPALGTTVTIVLFFWTGTRWIGTTGPSK